MAPGTLIYQSGGEVSLGLHTPKLKRFPFRLLPRIPTNRNLTYTVKSTKDKSDLQLVRGIDGFLEPGACTALM